MENKRISLPFCNINTDEFLDYSFFKKEAEVFDKFERHLSAEKGIMKLTKYNVYNKIFFKPLFDYLFNLHNKGSLKNILAIYSYLNLRAYNNIHKPQLNKEYLDKSVIDILKYKNKLLNNEEYYNIIKECDLILRNCLRNYITYLKEELYNENRETGDPL